MTGAIFARGSCRALKWMALVGVVLGLGAGEAFAQITVDLADSVHSVREGTRLKIDFDVEITVDSTTFPAEGDDLTFTATLAGSAGGVTAVPDDMVREGLTVGENEDLGSLSEEVSITLPAGQSSGSVSGSVWFDTETDVDAEDEYFTVTYTSIDVPTGVTDGDDDTLDELPEPGAVIIEDRHDQEFVWQNTDGEDITSATLEEGKSATFTLVARPALEQATYNTHFRTSEDAYEIDTADHEFATATANSVAITITAPEDDGNQTEDRITLTAFKAGTSTTRATLPITVADTDPLEVLRPRSQTDIDAAVMRSRANAAGSDGRWVRGDSNISVSLDELFYLPADGYRVTASVDVDDTDTIIGSGIYNSRSDPDRKYVYLHAGDPGTATVTVIASAEMISSSATMQLTDTSAQVEFSLTVDAPEPREPRVESTDAAIKAFDLVGAEKRRIGGVERLHIDEGTRTDVSATVEWSVGQLREIYDLDSTPDPVVIRFTWQCCSDALPDWLSPADPTFDPSEDFGDDNWKISIKIPKRPAATKKDWERVSADGKTPFNIHEDTDAEDEAFEIVATSGSSDVSLNASNSKTSTGLVVIDDDETQGIEIKRITKGVIYESGDDQVFEVSADPELVDLSLEVDFDLRTADGSDVPRAYGVSPSSDTISAGQKASVTVDIDENDGNRKNDDLVLHADIDSRNRSDVEVDTYSFKVLDVHMLPPLMVSPKEDSVKEGGEVELTLTIDRNPANTIRIDNETRQHTAEAIDVMLSMGAGTTAGMGDYTLPSKVTFPKHNEKAPWTQEMKVKVMANEDDDLDGGEMLVLDAMVAGTEKDHGEEKMSHAGVSMLTIEESTGKLVWAKTPEEVEAAVMAAKKEGMGDDMMFTAGETIELEGNDLFGSAEGVTVGYTAMVEGDAVSESVSGGVVTITADSMGMAKVTITARASRPSGAVAINDQTDPREASITVALEVGLVALSIELTGPEDMNLVEGGMGGMVTATANRAVTEDTVVNLMRDRAMSSADDADFTAEPITIMAGQMKGSTMVMAVADDDDTENEGNMTEELVLYGMAADNAGEVTGHVKFYLWDAAVPALPVIAQLLLAALMAVGGYRRYRRR